MKKFLSGRSMIEMLGVLAVIGILSVGTVNVYRNAMLRYRLGQTQYWIENVRFIITEACENGNKNVCFNNSQGETNLYKRTADYVCSMGEKYFCPKHGGLYGDIQTPLKESLLLINMSVAVDKLQLFFRGLDKKTCKAVVNYDWNGLTKIENYGTSTRESVQVGQKYLTQEQKDRLSDACPFPMYIVLTFDLNS